MIIAHLLTRMLTYREMLPEGTLELYCEQSEHCELFFRALHNKQYTRQPVGKNYSHYSHPSKITKIIWSTKAFIYPDASKQQGKHSSDTQPEALVYMADFFNDVFRVHCTCDTLCSHLPDTCTRGNAFMYRRKPDTVISALFVGTPRTLQLTRYTTHGVRYTTLSDPIRKHGDNTVTGYRKLHMSSMMIIHFITDEGRIDEKGTYINAS